MVLKTYTILDPLQVHVYNKNIVFSRRFGWDSTASRTTHYSVANTLLY